MNRFQWPVITVESGGFFQARQLLVYSCQTNTRHVFAYSTYTYNHSPSKLPYVQLPQIQTSSSSQPNHATSNYKPITGSQFWDFSNFRVNKITGVLKATLIFSGRERVYLKNKHDGFKGKRETDVYLIVILIIKFKKKKKQNSKNK